MLRAAAWVFGAGLLALCLKAYLPLPALAYLLLPGLGALFAHGLARHAETLGLGRTMRVLLLANPFSWVAAGLLVVAVAGLASPDAMNLGPAIGLFALFFVGVYGLWVLGLGRALPHPRAAALYGALGGLFGDALPAFLAYCPIGPGGLLAGAAALVLGRPRTPPSAPGPAPRAASEAPRGR